MYGPGRPPSASKHSAVSSVTQAAFSSFAAAAHLALATSCVVPCSSGTGCQLKLIDAVAASHISMTAEVNMQQAMG